MVKEILNILRGTSENPAAEERMLVFLVFMGVLAITYSILFIVDFLPEKPSEKEPEGVVEEIEEDFTPNPVVEQAVTVRDPLPSKIIFDELNREVTVLNPASESIAALDAALLDGVVRHPGSADFANDGTMFLFGHSSYLPVVRNKNFQAFNGIQKLEWGDTVRVQSSEREYVYRVDRVYQVRASDAEIEIERGRARLTLVTCNSFGSKDDRYVLEATLVDSYALPA